MIGYCTHCKIKTSIKDRKASKTRKGKYTSRGTCNECGHKMTLLISKVMYEEEVRRNSFEQQGTI